LLASGASLRGPVRFFASSVGSTSYGRVVYLGRRHPAVGHGPDRQHPAFVAVLHDVDRGRRARIIVRECLIALRSCSSRFFSAAPSSICWASPTRRSTSAGGVILFLIALRIIFKHPEGVFWQ